jgi:TonB family protein
VLQSKLIQPQDFSAISPADRNTTTTTTATPLRISTGVVGPKLIHTVDIIGDDEWTARIPTIDRKVVVNMLVDAKGTPSDLKIVESVGEEMDKHVLAAVSQYRFKPGTLNHEPTTVPLNLEITLRSSLR